MARPEYPGGLVVMKLSGWWHMPVVLEAEQFFPDKAPWPDGVEQYTEQHTELVNGESSTWLGWRIQTLEGPHIVTPGDWIITGVKGEKYPCKPDIFDATYDAVEGTP